METVTILTEEDMVKAMLDKGPLAPKGHVYYPENVKTSIKEELQSHLQSHKTERHLK